MNPIGLLEQQEEFRRLSQQIHFLNEKARVEAKRKKWYFQLIRRVRRLRKRLLRDLEFAGTWRVVGEAMSRYADVA